MSGTVNLTLVVLSVIVAVLASYTAFAVVARLARSRGRLARLWIIGGALAVGIGIWSMHFLGLLAFSLPVSLAEDGVFTLASLGIAVATCAVGLSAAARPQLSPKELVANGTLAGLGVAAMLYCGMAAVRIVPPITYDATLVAVSIVLSILACCAGLRLAFWLRTGRSWQMYLARSASAVVLGVAVAAAHYIAMTAAHFSSGDPGIESISLPNGWLAVSVALLALAVTSVTLTLVAYDAHRDSSSRRHSRQLQAANEQLQHLATHDSLTGLPNRLLLNDRLAEAIARAERAGAQLAVMVLDLDRFKSVNDSLGHQAGDRMLCEVAVRLTAVLRRDDTLARLGGDEFVLILNAVTGARDAESVAQKVLDTVRQPMAISGIEVHPSPSIGISLYPWHATDAETLLAHADAAMSHVKKNGRNGHAFFAPQMIAFARERLEMENGLRRALTHGEFVLHYQPKVDMLTGRIQSAEALVRWRHPTQGLVGPDAFIPLAEETGLIVPLGEWVLREACRQARAWMLDGGPPMRVAVNLSAQQFRHSNLIGVVRSTLADTGLDARYLEVELTESAVMHEAEQSARILRELADLGVRISVDDFGTGYSSLSYLKRLPLDKLKIDRSFIRDVVHNSDDAAIVTAIVSLAHSLRLKVIAEGVETAEQLEFLRRLGCDQYQGYYCSPAVPADEFAALVRAQQPLPPSPAVDLNDTIVARRLRRV